MPDTPRTAAALAALFADNSSGQISEQDLRDGNVSWWNVVDDPVSDLAKILLDNPDATSMRDTLDAAQTSHYHDGNDIITGVVAILHGGTGQTSANGAINALVPSQSLQAGKVLGTNGTVVSWVTSSGGSPGGSSGQIQFNSSSTFAGSSKLTWSDSTGRLEVTGDVNHSGSSGGVAQITVRGTGSSTHRLNIGYDTIANCGFIEGVNQGIAWESVSLQPSGGSVGIGVIGSIAATLHVAGNVLVQGTNPTLTIGDTNGSGACGTVQWDSTNHVLVVGNTAANRVALAVRGSASQSVNLCEFQNSSGTALAAVGPEGAFIFVPSTPATITANQNDYAPGSAALQRWSANAARDVTGMVAGVAGEGRTIINVGANAITFKHQDSGSSSVNRFLCASGADIVVAANEGAYAVYDGTTQRWRLF